MKFQTLIALLLISSSNLFSQIRADLKLNWNGIKIMDDRLHALPFMLNVSSYFQQESIDFNHITLSDAKLSLISVQQLGSSKAFDKSRVFFPDAKSLLYGLRTNLFSGRKRQWLHNGSLNNIYSLDPLELEIAGVYKINDQIYLQLQVLGGVSVAVFNPSSLNDFYSSLEERQEASELNECIDCFVRTNSDGLFEAFPFVESSFTFSYKSFKLRTNYNYAHFTVENWRGYKLDDKLGKRTQVQNFSIELSKEIYKTNKKYDLVAFAGLIATRFNSKSYISTYRKEKGPDHTEDYLGWTERKYTPLNLTSTKKLEDYHMLNIGLRIFLK